VLFFILLAARGGSVKPDASTVNGGGLYLEVTLSGKKHAGLTARHLEFDQW
jgi:hypothetical protein